MTTANFLYQYFVFKVKSARVGDDWVLLTAILFRMQLNFIELCIFISVAWNIHTNERVALYHGNITR